MRPAGARPASALALALALSLALSVAAPAPARADPPAEAARIAALQLLDAVEGLAAARSANDQVSALTRTILAHETALEALRRGLDEATQAEAEMVRQFEFRSQSVAQLVSAMLAVGRVQGPDLLLHPAGPLGTARAGMLIAELVPAMQAEADLIAARLADLRNLQRLRDTAATVLAEGLDSLQTARDALGQAVAARRTPPPPVGQDEALMLALLESAQTLTELSEGLGAVLPEAEAGTPDLPAGRTLLPLPVRGLLDPRSTTTSPARPGLVIVTGAGALVTAPLPARLLYRGALDDYGNVILLDPGEGYVLVIAGLETVFPDLGELVPAGGPLGMMPGTAPGDGPPVGMTDQTAGLSAADGAAPSLYLELRRGGQPIDPGAWFDLTGAIR
jgi:murein hydrolase activator